MLPYLASVLHLIFCLIYQRSGTVHISHSSFLLPSVEDRNLSAILIDMKVELKAIPGSSINLQNHRKRHGRWDPKWESTEDWQIRVALASAYEQCKKR